VPLNTFFLGLGVIVDRESGAQRELLAAPVPRGLLVLGNLGVALAITALQVGTLIGFAAARRIHFDVQGLHVLWFVGAALLLTVAMYGAAETLAARIPRQEEYIARIPAIAIAPWFLAGSLFPITAMPVGLTWIARFLPLTHALALMRYGLNRDPSGLHAIWQMHDATDMAVLSLIVLGLFALALTRVAIRAFARSATN
jgi:ABC-type multidrug transport system permease subunit